MPAAETATLIPFDNHYARLPERFFRRLPPTPVAAPRLLKLNTALALELGLDAGRLASPDGVAILAGNKVADGSEPLAQAYAGHQFGGFVPQLGDGRAILLGEVVDRKGRRRDIQLKGSGPTPFSRRGDGRAALGPVLREYIVSEAFAALGIPSTRSLAAVATGEHVWRETPLPGAVLTRVAASHIRVGTFQFFAAREDTDAIRTLADHVIARHYPDAADAPNRYRAMLDAVIAAQARLVARWLHIGFIHGVMNTDNMSIAGETIDFGPCAFMDTFNPAQVYSSIDRQGRYAYGNQARIAMWNLARLAETLLPVLAEGEEAQLAEANAAIQAFPDLFERAYLDGLLAKIGLGGSAPPSEADKALVIALLEHMKDGGADFTLTFRRLADVAADPGAEAALAAGFEGAAGIGEWLGRWRERLSATGRAPAEIRHAMRAVNPAFIPRNHRIEEAITAALGDDFGPFETLVEVLQRPYEDQPEHAGYMEPPKPDEIVHQTFCGT